jgi:hypothetical protein
LVLLFPRTPVPVLLAPRMPMPELVLVALTHGVVPFVAHVTAVCSAAMSVPAIAGWVMLRIDTADAARAPVPR